MQLNLQIENQGEWELVKIVGPINEDAEVTLTSYTNQLGKNLIFNFQQVSTINSCGVRAWINFLRVLENGRNIIFRECTPEVISQVNMIPNFRSHAKIDSLYAEYSCENCGTEKMVLFEKGKNMPNSPDDELPPVKCDQCGERMEMDELEEEFFGFLESAA